MGVFSNMAETEKHVCPKCRAKVKQSCRGWSPRLNDWDPNYSASANHDERYALVDWPAVHARQKRAEKKRSAK